MVGAASGAEAFVRLLLEKGADPSRRDAEGRTALDFARQYRHDAIVLRLQPISPRSQPAPATKRIRYVAPTYPRIAREAGVEGVVVIRLALEPDGRVTEAIVSCSIPLLQEAALAAVKQWQYLPPGRNERVYFLVPVSFRRLRDDVMRAMQQRVQHRVAVDCGLRDHAPTRLEASLSLWQRIRQPSATNCREARRSLNCSG